MGNQDILRADDSTTDFSWLACIDGRNERREIFDAFRNAINQQVEEFKFDQLKINSTCEYTNEKLHTGNTHVDHKFPKTFYTIVSDFLENEKVDHMDVQVTEPMDNQFTTSLIDIDFIERWQNYHKQVADLRIISQTANLSHAKLM